MGWFGYKKVQQKFIIMRIVLLFTFLLSVTAQQKNTIDKNNGQLAGLPCAVSLNGTQTRSISVYIKDNGDIKGEAWTYTPMVGCGSKDGKNLTCVGDWGEKWEEECPEGTAEPMGKVIYSDKCKSGCGGKARETGACESGWFARGTCRFAGEDGWADGPIIFVVCMSVVVVLFIVWWNIWIPRKRKQQQQQQYKQVEDNKEDNKEDTVTGATQVQAPVLVKFHF